MDEPAGVVAAAEVVLRRRAEVGEIGILVRGLVTVAALVVAETTSFP
jgi:hypothetical protein